MRSDKLPHHSAYLYCLVYVGSSGIAGSIYSNLRNFSVEGLSLMA